MENDIVKVGTQGSVQLIDHMGNDYSIVQAARVSYYSENETEFKQSDASLLEYLMKHEHLTPFEMVEFKFRITVPMDIWRQFVRHRTASINERSTRYTNATLKFNTYSGTWRTQDESGVLIASDIQDLCAEEERVINDLCYSTYINRLSRGIAREQARKDLPLSLFTTAYWKIDLRNLMNFLKLRLASNAQQEIQEYAYAIKQLITPIVPVTMEMFSKHIENAVTISADLFNNIRDAMQAISLEDRASVFNEIFNHVSRNSGTTLTQERTMVKQLLNI